MSSLLPELFSLYREPWLAGKEAIPFAWQHGEDKSSEELHISHPHQVFRTSQAQKFRQIMGLR
jgi:hypothetical protein